jgi:hypothetical protein
MNRRHSASLLSGAVIAAVVALAPRVHASPEFPEKIQELLGMSCAPPCTICHLDSSGGAATATKPFAENMYETGGLRPEQPGTVGPALDALEGKGGGAGSGGASDAGAGDAASDAAGGSGGSGGSSGTVIDSDEDGMGDVEELRNDRDPNVFGAGIVCGPTYGCGARVAPRGRVDGLALGAALAVAGALLLSMRRWR